MNGRSLSRLPAAVGSEIDAESAIRRTRTNFAIGASLPHDEREFSLLGTVTPVTVLRKTVNAHSVNCHNDVSGFQARAASEVVLLLHNDAVTRRRCEIRERDLFDSLWK